MENNFLKRGADVVKLAIKADDEKLYAEAVKQYKNAGTCLWLNLRSFVGLYLHAIPVAGKCFVCLCIIRLTLVYSHYYFHLSR